MFLEPLHKANDSQDLTSPQFDLIIPSTHVQYINEQIKF